MDPPSVKNNDLRKRPLKFSQQQSLHKLQSFGFKLSQIVYQVTLEGSVDLPAVLVHKQRLPHPLDKPAQPCFGYVGTAAAVQTEVLQHHLLLSVSLHPVTSQYWWWGHSHPWTACSWLLSCGGCPCWNPPPLQQLSLQCAPFQRSQSLSSYKSTELNTLLAFFFSMQNTLQKLAAAHSLVQRDDFLPYMVWESSRQVLLARWWVLNSSQLLRLEHGPVTTIKITAIIKWLFVYCLWWNQYNMYTWHLLVHHLHDGMISK